MPLNIAAMNEVSTACFCCNLTFLKAYHMAETSKGQILFVPSCRGNHTGSHNSTCDKTQPIFLLMLSQGNFSPYNYMLARCASDAGSINTYFAIAINHQRNKVIAFLNIL